MRANGNYVVEPGSDGHGNPARTAMMLRLAELQAAEQARRN
jgi:hypothetical protein